MRGKNGFIDMTGEKHNRLLVVSYFGKDKGRKSMWLCKCDCGKKCIVDGYKIRTGKTKSCGCLSSELAKERLTTHGMSSSRIYSIHNAMNERCFNSNTIEYHNYGGRGITVCEEWKGRKGFENFAKWSFENGYADNLSIDRIDVNGNYEPNNCRWITHKEQCNNTRFNKIIEYQGEKHTLKEWSEILKIPYKRLKRRLDLGWNVEKAFETQKMKNQYF